MRASSNFSLPYMNMNALLYLFIALYSLFYLFYLAVWSYVPLEMICANQRYALFSIVCFLLGNYFRPKSLRQSAEVYTPKPNSIYLLLFCHPIQPLALFAASLLLPSFFVLISMHSPQKVFLNMNLSTFPLLQDVLWTTVYAMYVNTITFNHFKNSKNIYF